MNSLAARLAPKVDRLVLGVNRAVGPRHGHVLMAVARELGLDSLKLIPHFVDFWLNGSLPANVAVARLPYAPDGAVLARIERFVSDGLLSETPSGFEPSSRFRPLLAASLAAREETVLAMWTGFDQTIADVGPLVDRVIQAVPESHTVAVAHRALTHAPDPFLRTYDRLVTMRFIRQHDHVEAWRGRGMTAAGMTALTALWHGDPVPDEASGLTHLEENGLALAGLITEAGRRLRDEIEADTNARGARAFSVLDQSEAHRLLELLTHLPSSTER
jgi:hypothetical protein